MEEFVIFEIAKKLKEKGFPQHWSNDDYIVENEYEDNFEVGSHYDRCFIPEHLPTVAAPSIYQALKWLREEKKYYISIGYNGDYSYEIVGIEDGEFVAAEDDYNTHEEAALAGIEYLLDNVI